MRKLKWVSIYSIISLVVIQLISFGISYYYEFSFLDTLFMVGVIVLMMGLLLSMQGKSFFANNFIPGGNDLRTHVVSVLEAEREIQEIQSQGTIKYVTENRMLRFRTIPVSMIISGVTTILILFLFP